MKRWSSDHSCEIEDVKVDKFLKEVVDVCKKHGFSISHEDEHGAFTIVVFNNENVDWLMDAHIRLGEGNYWNKLKGTGKRGQ